MDIVKNKPTVIHTPTTMGYTPASNEALLFKQQRNIPDYFNIVGEIFKRSKNTASSKPALFHEDETLTWGELSNRIYGYQRIYDQLDIQEGSRVALISLDSSHMALALLSLIFRGCTVILINPMLSDKEVHLQLASAAVDVALVEKELDTTHAKQTVRYISLTALDIIYAQLNKGMINFDYSYPSSAFSPAFGVFTSGSTGKPKLAIHCHLDFMVALTRYADQVLDVHKSDVIFCASRLSFAFGLQNMFLALLNGATYLLPPVAITRDSVVKAIEKAKATTMFAVPRVYNMLLDQHEANAQALSSLRLCISAGESLPLATEQAWKSSFDTEIISSLGSTEVFSTYISNIPNSNKSGATGKLVPGFQAKLISHSGSPSQIDEAGVLWIRGPSVITQYDDTQLERQLFSDGWFCTNDVFKQDIDGYYYFIGRNNEMIKINGLWVSPNEIEDTLKTVEAIADAAVVPFSHDNGSPGVKAFIIPQKGYEKPSESEIKEYCKSTMSSWKYPHFIEFVDELPRTVTGKLARHLLRDKVFLNK